MKTWKEIKDKIDRSLEDTDYIHYIDIDGYSEIEITIIEHKDCREAEIRYK